MSCHRDVAGCHGSVTLGRGALTGRVARRAGLDRRSRGSGDPSGSVWCAPSPGGETELGCRARGRAAVVRIDDGLTWRRGHSGSSLHGSSVASSMAGPAGERGRRWGCERDGRDSNSASASPVSGRTPWILDFRQGCSCCHPLQTGPLTRVPQSIAGVGGMRKAPGAADALPGPSDTTSM